MELAPAGTPLTFEVTFDSPSLNVAMSVYNTTGPSPVLVQGPLAMTNVVGNTYIGKFTATVGFTYLIFKAVYTDGTFATLSPDYSQGTESIAAQNIGQSISDYPVVGYVVCDLPVIGPINC